jgi:hypothetical protein
VYDCGLVQAANGAPSTEHSNVAPSSDVNSKVALDDAEGFGGVTVIVVSGASRSTVQVNDSVGPVFPTGSVAFTSKV